MGRSAGEVAERGFLQQGDSRDGSFQPSGAVALLAPQRPEVLPEPVRSPADPEPPAAGPLALAQRLRQRAATAVERTEDAVSLELARGAAFTLVPVFLGTGALAYFFAGTEPTFLFLASAAVATGVAALLARRWTYVHLLAAALCCVALGALFGKVETWRAGTQMLGGEISTRVTGRVVSLDAMANGRFRVTMDVLSTERPRLRYAPGRIRLSTRTLPAGTKAGDVLVGAARLIPPLGPVRPGSYDFSFFSYFNGIGASGYFLGTPLPASGESDAGWRQRLGATIQNIRSALADRIRSRIPGAEGEIAAALIAGVEAGIPEDINEDLRRTGLAHVLSISGLHMALVAATVIGSMRFAFALFPGFASRHPVRKYAAAVALVFLAVYLLISGYAVAAQRSFIMIAVMLVALLFDRQALTMRNLALSAIVILVLSPHEIVGPSFQMSFAATAALIGAYGGWTRRRPAAHRREQGTVMRLLHVCATYVGGLVVTSLLAGTATTIFSAYHFQRVSPLSLFANLAAMPAVSILVMPFAVLGVVLMPVGLDGLPLAVMGEGLEIMDAVAAWFSARSPLDAIGLLDARAVILLSIGLVLLTALTTWLRAAALPFALAGLFLCFLSPAPLAFIAENARQVGVRTGDGALALNQGRQGSFNLLNWKRALPTEDVLKPRHLGNEDDLPWDAVMDSEDGRFQCNEIACATLSHRLLVVTTPYRNIAALLCDVADLIVLSDAAAGNPCAGHAVIMVTRRDLARRGSAMIFAEKAVGAESSIRSPFYAAVTPYRPWHRHRQFSREARGLAPWKPDPGRARKSFVDRGKRLD